jgi:hypothetical protein
MMVPEVASGKSKLRIFRYQWEMGWVSPPTETSEREMMLNCV